MATSENTARLSRDSPPSPRLGPPEVTQDGPSGLALPRPRPPTSPWFSRPRGCVDALSPFVDLLFFADFVLGTTAELSPTASRWLASVTPTSLDPDLRTTATLLRPRDAESEGEGEHENDRARLSRSNAGPAPRAAPGLAVLKFVANDDMSLLGLDPAGPLQGLVSLSPKVRSARSATARTLSSAKTLRPLRAPHLPGRARASLVFSRPPPRDRLSVISSRALYVLSTRGSRGSRCLVPCGSL